ncbi:hypothetical protein ARMGADRAFT_1040548 [Armillaria gallica]|uniref:Uncharacterized protein n=1 Tax=Armillaria gallica TaxID=47427 RepID=A0A2H3CSQ7_ARMGA|nr:hypothetical protein ARMGADRAFT_1040548 [Armillaria gallica]
MTHHQEIVDPISPLEKHTCSAPSSHSKTAVSKRTGIQCQPALHYFDGIFSKGVINEDELLEDMLQEMWAGEIPGSDGSLCVCINYWQYRKLQKVLAKQKQRAIQSLTAYGHADLECPKWNQDPCIFMMLNDFELHSFCYRAFVKDFLALIDASQVCYEDTRDTAKLSSSIREPPTYEFSPKWTLQHEKN